MIIARNNEIPVKSTGEKLQDKIEQIYLNKNTNPQIRRAYTEVEKFQSNRRNINSNPYQGNNMRLNGLGNYINPKKEISLSTVRKQLQSERLEILAKKYNIPLTEVHILNELLNYKFEGKIHQKKLDKFNGAEQVDIFMEDDYKQLKNPKTILTVLKYLSVTEGKRISYGLRLTPKYGKKLHVPFTIQYDENKTVGIFFVDQKRPLSVKKILNIEKIVKACGLSGAKIIANQIGLPAKNFVKKLNEELNCSEDAYEMQQVDSIVKELKMGFQ